MKQPFSLGGRLGLCAEFVTPGAKVADIGTDHAYLPVWLCKMNIAKSALACDIGQEPLQRGINTIKKYNAQPQVRPVLCDGLQGISPDDVTDVIIAGMGGETICGILTRWEYSPAENIRFILQPMTRSEVLIEFLCKNGYEIIRQECCRDKKIYTVILAEYTGRLCDYPEEFFYLGRLSPKTNSLDRQFIEKQIRNLENKSKGSGSFLPLIEKIREHL